MNIAFDSWRIEEIPESGYSQPFVFQLLYMLESEHGCE